MPTITCSEEEYIKILLKRIGQKTVIDGDCWRYTGKHAYSAHAEKGSAGYGCITYRNKTIRLNRFIAYAFHNMPLNSDLTANHKPECKFTDCWNPDHIYSGTPRMNVQDTIEKGTFSYGTNNLRGGTNHNLEAWKQSFRDNRRRKLCQP